MLGGRSGLTVSAQQLSFALERKPSMAGKPLWEIENGEFLVSRRSKGLPDESSR
jgi:hypothetical protein